jgi:PAS domain S-box-containing protein/putative nucleotidyltransferase with HDIG domain
LWGESMDKLQQAAYRSLQDKDQRGIFTTDAHLHLSSWNRWLEVHSGLSQADVLGRQLLKLYPKAAARLEPLYRQALEDQVVIISPRLHRYLLPLPLVESRGEQYMRQGARILPLYDDGRVIGTLTLIEDVSERFLRDGELRQHIHRLQDTEKALRLQERQFRTLVDANQDLVMVLEDNGDIRYLSPSVVNLLGDQPELHIVRWLPGLIHPQDRPAVIESFRAVRHAVNLAQTGKFRLRGKEGDWRMIEATFQNLAGHAEDAGIAIYGRDITARWQAEQALRERMKELTCSYAVSSDLQKGLSIDEICQLAVEHLVTAMQFPEITVSVIDLNGKRFASENYTEGLSNCLHTEIRMKGEVLGHLRIYHTEEKPFLIPEEQNLLKGVAESISTLLERNHAEESQRHSEARLRLLIESAPDAIFVQTQHCFAYLNPAAIKLFGAESADQLLGQPVLERFDPRFHDLARERIRTLSEEKKGVSLVAYINLKLDGSSFHGEVSAVPISWEGQDGALVFLRDITERNQAEKTIKELNVLLRAIKEINEALLRVKSEPDLFQQTCDLLIQVPNIRFTWIGLLQPESFEIKPVACAGYEAGYLDDIRVTWDDSPHGEGAIGRAIKTGQPVVMEDIAGDPGAIPWREAALKRGYSYMMALPLIYGDLIIGTLNVYSEKQNVFREDEKEFLQQVAGDIAVGVRSLRFEQEMVQSLIKLQIMMIQTIEAIASMAELRDPYTTGHQQRVTRLVLALAQETSLAPEPTEGLRVASLIHDIGKIVVPAEILSRPGKISHMEMNLIKAHPQAGYDILKKIAFPWPVAQIVLQHHERLDGSGYPQGLKSSDILQEAKILAVADVIEAMSSHRPYRPGLGIEKALEEIKQNKSTLYDPEVVDACVKLFTEKDFKFE